MTKFSITVRKAGKTYDIDESAFGDNIVRHIHEYGWRQNLQDAAATAKTAEEADAMVQKRLDAFRNGIVRTFGVTAANVEDVAYAEVTRAFLEGKGPEYTKTALKKAIKTKAQAELVFAEYVMAVAERQGKTFSESMVEANWTKLISPKAKAMLKALSQPADDVDLDM